MIAALQSEILGEKDSDCGTLRCIDVTITDKNKKLYTDRYIKKGNDYVLITNENISSYVGKTVKMRSPMYCIGVGKEKCLCNKCAGDFYYKLGKKNVGLVASKVATSCTQLNLQKFHENLVKIQQLDVNDLLI